MGTITYYERSDIIVVCNTHIVVYRHLKRAALNFVQSFHAFSIDFPRVPVRSNFSDSNMQLPFCLLYEWSLFPYTSLFLARQQRRFRHLVIHSNPSNLHYACSRVVCPVVANTVGQNQSRFLHSLRLT